MSEATVTFLPHGKKISVPLGHRLIRAALEAGVHINASCGGEGVCGKCRVIIESGEVEGGISDRLTAADLEKGYRLACRSRVKGDLTVGFPWSPKWTPVYSTSRLLPERRLVFRK